MSLFNYCAFKDSSTALAKCGKCFLIHKLVKTIIVECVVGLIKVCQSASGYITVNYLTVIWQHIELYDDI